MKLPAAKPRQPYREAGEGESPNRFGGGTLGSGMPSAGASDIWAGAMRESGRREPAWRSPLSPVLRTVLNRRHHSQRPMRANLSQESPRPPSRPRARFCRVFRGRERGRSGFRMEERLRLEQPVEAFGPQPGFEFSVAAPEPSVQMQCQGDEGRILRVHVPAQAAGLLPRPRSLGPLGSKAPFVRLPPLRLDVLGQLPGGFRREFAAADDALHAKPGDEVVDLARRHACSRDRHLQAVILGFDSNHRTKVHPATVARQGAFVSFYQTTSGGSYRVTVAAPGSAR